MLLAAPCLPQTPEQNLQEDGEIRRRRSPLSELMGRRTPPLARTPGEVGRGLTREHHVALCPSEPGSLEGEVVGGR